MRETLNQLQEKLQKLDQTYREQRAVIEKAIAEARKSEMIEAQKKIRALMVEHGLSVTDLKDFEKPKAKMKAKNSSKSVAVKYKGPNGETWTGRGRQPKWIGDDREKFRIG